MRSQVHHVASGRSWGSVPSRRVSTGVFRFPTVDVPVQSRVDPPGFLSTLGGALVDLSGRWEPVPHLDPRQ